MFARKKLAAYLRERGITQTAFAKCLGVTEGTVRHIVVGIKQPSFAMACDIADAMGCSVDELREREDVCSAEP
ncbi:MAG: helix-turn-helix transcriptional regulator [Clostridia bacterium]|nr:helix-turn-helix transcriptional regulator [Clostridia bacterium]